MAKLPSCRLFGLGVALSLTKSLAAVIAASCYYPLGVSRNDVGVPWGTGTRSEHSAMDTATASPCPADAEDWPSRSATTRG